MNSPEISVTVIKISEQGQALAGIGYSVITKETARLLLPLIQDELSAINSAGEEANMRTFGDPEGSGSGIQHISPRGVALYGLGRTIRQTFGEDIEEPELGL